MAELLESSWPNWAPGVRPEWTPRKRDIRPENDPSRKLRRICRALESRIVHLTTDCVKCAQLYHYDRLCSNGDEIARCVWLYQTAVQAYTVKDTARYGLKVRY